MKMTNLSSVQQKYMPTQERKTQKFIRVVLFMPLILVIIVFLPAISNPEALFSSIFISVDILLMALIMVFVVSQRKKKFLKAFTAEQLERIESECLSAPHFDGFMVTREALMYFMPGILALPIEELIWVYPVKKIHHTGVLLEKTYYAIAAVTKNKKEYLLLRENMDPERMNQSMKFLSENLPQLRSRIILGYSEELYNIFKKDFKLMVQMVEFGTGFDKDTIIPKNNCEPMQQEIVH